MDNVFNQVQAPQQQQNVANVQQQQFVGGVSVQPQVGNYIDNQVQQQVVSTQPQAQVNTQAVFTQEQINNILQSRINPLNTKVNELTNNLTVAQKQANDYLTELNSLKQNNFLGSLGLTPDLIDYVKFEASKLAVNGKSFEDAAKEFVQSPVGSKLLNVVTQQVGMQQPLVQAQAVVPQGMQNIQQPANTQTALQQTLANQQQMLYNPQLLANQQAVPQQNVVQQVNGVASGSTGFNLGQSSTSAISGVTDALAKRGYKI